MRRLLIIKIRQCHARKALIDEALNILDHRLLIRRNKTERIPGRLGPCGPPDPMDIILRGGRDIKVDDMRDVFDINPPRVEVKSRAGPPLIWSL